MVYDKDMDDSIAELAKLCSSAGSEYLPQEILTTCVKLGIEPSSALKEEMKRGEYPDLPRLVMKSDLHDYGRLFELIHIINEDHNP